MCTLFNRVNVFKIKISDIKQFINKPNYIFQGYVAVAIYREILTSYPELNSAINNKKALIGHFKEIRW